MSQYLTPNLVVLARALRPGGCGFEIHDLSFTLSAHRFGLVHVIVIIMLISQSFVLSQTRESCQHVKS